MASEVAERIRSHGLIAIIRGDFSLDELHQLAEALQVGGIGVLEVTLNSRHALEGIKALYRSFGNSLLIGAGTVQHATDVDAALDASARFLVAPNLDLASVRRAQEREALLIPGVFTATEAVTACVAGCNIVKLFPANALGPRYLQALRAPLNDIEFVPTGGIDAQTLADYHRVGAVAYGVGSALVRNQPVTHDELSALTKRAQSLGHALMQARGSV